MKRFGRAACPDFWADREAAWKASDPRTSGKDAFTNRKHENRSIGRWFHELVRADGHTRNRAYCDGPLGETSPDTIDHFIPERLTPELGLSWRNLYPACTSCNSTRKRDRWEMVLIRPEEAEDWWFDFDPQTGEIRPAADLDPITACRVEVTLEIFGLDHEVRRRARVRVWTSLLNAWKHPRDDFTIDDYVTQGPYRWVAERFVAAMTAPSAPMRGEGL